VRFEYWFYTIPLRVRSLFRRSRVEDELDEELRYHIERQIENNVANGMSEEEARLAALRAMGGLDQRKEECRDARRTRFIENLWQDFGFGLDHRVLLFTLGIAAVTCFSFGLLPALQASKTDLQTTLKDSGRSTAGRSPERTRRVLLVAEVSVSLVLLAGAGLLVRSMWNLLHVDPGFNMDNMLTMRMSLADPKYTDQFLRVFVDECIARVQAVPGVRSVALTHSLPIDGTNWSGVFLAADKPCPRVLTFRNQIASV
jgi:hypothetical protein